MECKIIILLYTVIYQCTCQMPDFDVNGEFDPLQMGNFDADEEFDQDDQFDQFTQFQGFGTPGETSPVLHEETIEVEGRLGSSVKLPCHVTNPGIFTVGWLFTNKQLTDGDRVLGNKRHYDLELQYPGEWNLLVKDIRPDNAGEYVCVLQAYPPQMKSVHLVILAPPKIEKSSLMERYKVKEGLPLEIVCNVSGYPRPKVQWYSYHTNPNTLEEKKELFSNNNVLTIASLQRSNAGIYSCETSNSQGTDMYEIMVEPMYMPKPATISHDIVVKYGMAAKLECIYYSSPRAHIAWRKDGEELRQNWKYNIDAYKEEKLQGTELTIRTTDESDSGRYRCVAENSMGQHVTTFTVIVVKTTPTTAQQTTTTQASTTSTTLSTTSTTQTPTTSNRSYPIYTPVEIVDDQTTEKSTVNSPRTGESYSRASCTINSVVYISLTLTLSILLKVS